MVLADDERVTVLSVFRNSPAEGAGLMAGDKILAVDGENVVGATTEEVATKVKGEKGTTVKLTIGRDEETFEASIVRANIVAESVEGQLMEENIGYIQIEEFNANTAKEFNEVLDDLLARGAEGIIIDLRNNTGGIVSQVIAIASRIMGSGVIMYSEDSQGNRKENTAKGAGLDAPVVVLANEYSASASEILIGALQDHDRAVIVGKKSFGKGIIQTFGQNSDGSGYSITTEKYYTPNGTSIHEQGIEPDVEVSLPEEIEYVYGSVPRNLDTQLDEAIVQLRLQM
jgi:carboxyl-terminal processing protease